MLKQDWHTRSPPNPALTRPQLPLTRQVDTALTAWFRRHLTD
ncbi:hypothetical protein ACTG9Q_32885 [Actinokineospora sp. 24-640]